MEALYSDVRQLMTYVKEAHGGVFRRVALSGLLDSANRPYKGQSSKTTKNGNQAEIEEQSDLPMGSCYIMDEKGGRKFLFKKRSTTSACPSLIDTDIGEDIGMSAASAFSKISQSPIGNIRKKQHILTPRQSEKNMGTLGAEQTTASKTANKSKKGSKFPIVNWFRRDKTEPNDSESESPVESTFHRQSSLHHQLGRSPEKVGPSGIRRNSIDFGVHSRDSEFVVLKERKLVPLLPVYNGMLRFSFLLETCHPGTVPDANLLAAVLDLTCKSYTSKSKKKNGRSPKKYRIWERKEKRWRNGRDSRKLWINTNILFQPNAPVVSRASFLLECAYFVHCCNKGQWPSWMKLNFPIFRQSGPHSSRSVPSGLRRTHILQRTAGKMFFQWAEAIGARLEEMVNEDQQHVANVATMVADENKQKELLVLDEEEDFLDEASVIGGDCPIALRLVACILLLEVTAFLRETYQTLPKSSRHIQWWRCPMGSSLQQRS
ncbi:hypothetical protein J437_LFUL005956 [Ladona fulva]|uniref:Protein UNC80 central region domain-containing protein n=1 Tax=Ladona fulva TaxID=123851 RepID=A0A8K0NVB5_LADFU|nr:hypothetical protein J437_LFUL005956 [Ladona fulva]